MSVGAWNVSRGAPRSAALALAAVLSAVLVASCVEGARFVPAGEGFGKETLISGRGLGLDLNRNLRVDPANGTALDRYIAEADPTYKWEYNGTKQTGIIPGITGYTAYQVILTSQQWLTEAEAGDCSVWTHDMVVFIPDNLDKSIDTAAMFITEGLDPPTSKNDKEQNFLLAAACAVGTRSVVTALFQVPNQKCLFPDDPKKKLREEDAVIAYTWRKFIDLKRKGDPRADSWPLRLPMVKAAVRAMDATEEFLYKCTDCAKIPDKVDSFLTMGASKRGWTTWLTGAVDKRVIAEVPIVMDALNQHKLFHRWFQNFGGWSFAIHDYTDEDLMAELDSDEFQELLAIIDPYAYKERLTMPKLVITATGDEFFQSMDDHFWFDDMPGNNLLLRAANADHSEMTGIPVVLPSTISFFVNVVSDRMQSQGKEIAAIVKDDAAPRHPVLTWKTWTTNEDTVMEEAFMNVTVDVGKGPVPERVSMKYSHTDPNSGRIDWRWFNLDENCALPKIGNMCPIQLVWLDQELQAIEKDGDLWTYSTSMKSPPKGWAGFYVDLRFPGVSELFFELPYTVTTQTQIVPSTLPFPDCSGAACEGTLV